MPGSEEHLTNDGGHGPSPHLLLGTLTGWVLWKPGLEGGEHVWSSPPPAMTDAQGLGQPGEAAVCTLAGLQTLAGRHQQLLPESGIQSAQPTVWRVLPPRPVKCEVTPRGGSRNAGT